MSKVKLCDLLSPVDGDVKPLDHSRRSVGALEWTHAIIEENTIVPMLWTAAIVWTAAIYTQSILSTTYNLDNP